MVPRRVEVFGLLVAIGLVCQSAQAGDRKSARRSHEASDDIIVPSRTRAVSLKYDLTGTSTAKAFEAGSSAGRRSARDRGTPTGDASSREHRRLTLFHINSKFGDVAVEPVIGHVNGAQFSIGF